MKLRCYRDCRAGTENTGNASGKNYLKYLKYLKANVTNADTHPLQGFGQYAIPSHSWEEWEEGLGGPKRPNSNIICVTTHCSPHCHHGLHPSRGGNPHRRITRDRSNVPNERCSEMQFHSCFPMENFATS